MPLDNKSEIFIVVDRNDNIVDYRSRGECHSDPSLIHRSVALCIFNSKDEVLMQRRSMAKDTMPGFWVVSVCGHVTKGQTKEEAITREAQEEVGLIVKETNLECIGKYFLPEKNDSEIITVYRIDSEGPFKADENEVDELKFFSKMEIDKIRNGTTYRSIEILKNIGFIE